jgi:hypothetical protein
MVPLVKRLNEVVAGRSQDCRDFSVAHAGPARDVDRSTLKVIAVRDPADRPVVSGAAVDAGDCAEGGAETCGDRWIAGFNTRVYARGFNR